MGADSSKESHGEQNGGHKMAKIKRDQRDGGPPKPLDDINKLIKKKLKDRQVHERNILVLGKPLPEVWQ